MFPKLQPDGSFIVNGQRYTSAHEAIRAMSAARNAEPVEYQPKPETARERVRRERREMKGQ